MGGEIRIVSPDGGGTRVSVRIRAATESAGANETRVIKNSAPAESPRALRVLIVDDEPALGRALRSLLAVDHHVQLAANGVEALELLASGPAPDVVLCDLMMPGMTGPELHARVLSERPALAARFVFMTGGAVTSQAEHFLAATPNPLLQKPFRPAELTDAMRRVMSG